MKDPQGVIYITDGAAGQDYFTPAPYANLNYTIFSDVKLGLGNMTVFNETHLLYEHILTETKEVIDYLYIIKSPQEPNIRTSAIVALSVFGSLAIVMMISGLIFIYKKINIQKNRVYIRRLIQRY